jgi:AcrR family transcriptional regulator
MVRWQPNASERLVSAALDLFAERGYDETTVIEIAERAGLTKSTFFRHFPDKREVLFGGDALPRLLAERIEAAPAEVGPLAAVVAALESIGQEVFPPERRSVAVRRRAVIAASRELQEREALKGLSLIAAMTEALRRRDVPEVAADVAAELGALVMRIAYERWTGTAEGEAFADLVRRALEEVRAAAATC